MITENWIDVQRAREKAKPGVLFLFIEMRRPEPGIVIFEAPEYGVTRQFTGVENFAPLLKQFIDHDVGPIVVAKHPQGPGVCDVILIDPAWTDNKVETSKAASFPDMFGPECRTRKFPEEPGVRGLGYCYAHKKWCGNEGPPK